jgi:hypothetical protein
MQIKVVTFSIIMDVNLLEGLCHLQLLLPGERAEIGTKMLVLIAAAT